jgi:hypothetical protein
MENGNGINAMGGQAQDMGHGLGVRHHSGRGGTRFIDAKRHVRGLGGSLTWLPDTQEYLVAMPYPIKPGGIGFRRRKGVYFTTDLADAIATARLMAGCEVSEC